MKSAGARAWATSLVAGLGLLAFASAAGAAELPAGFQDAEVIKGLEEPTAFRFAPGGRVFVAEKSGEILVYDGLEDEEPTVFADMRKQVFDKGDRGLLGLALDPEFPARPYVYALYTFDHVLGEDAPGAYPRWGKPPDYVGDDCEITGLGVDDCPVSGRLVRLTAEGDHAVEEEGVLDEKVLIEDWCQQDSSHSIGDLQFGSEGALYASGGDGASFILPDYGQFGWPHTNQCGDPPGSLGEELEPPEAEGGSLRSQDVRTPEGPFGEDPTTLDGSLIRIDPESGEAWPGNPMEGSADLNARKIVAYGFRNPFRFAINPATNEVYVDNVGNGTYEEVDRFPIGAGQPYNSGWPCYEGPSPNPDFEFTGLNACESLYNEPGSTSPPFYYYDHAAGVTPEDSCPSYNGSAISGSAFNDGSAFPTEYEGAFFFSDSVRGCIYVMKADADGEPDPLTTAPFLTEGGLYPGVDIEMGPEGDLYYASLFGDEYGPGVIHRVSFDPGAPHARLSADRTSGKLNLEVHFNASASTSTDSEPLEFAWDLNGDGTFETEGAATHTVVFKTAENRTVSVRVTDARTGKSDVAGLTVYPGDSPPRVEIAEPSESTTWGVGQAIEFSGTAKAEEGHGGSISSAHLYWKSRLLHCPFGPETCHAHPLRVFPAVEAGALTTPDHDYPSYIELSLTATDGRGLSATKTLKLEPRPVPLSIASDPPGITLTAGLQTEPAPFAMTAIEGGTVALFAPQTASLGGMTYSFDHWSDGGPRSHAVAAESPAEYVAVYTSASRPSEGERPAAGTEGGTSPVEPRAALDRHPATKTRSTRARFGFSASPPASLFRCELDHGPFRACSSPRSYGHLALGWHVFRVEAVGPDGDRARPVVFRWKVLGKRAAG